MCVSGLVDAYLSIVLKRHNWLLQRNLQSLAD